MTTINLLPNTPLLPLFISATLIIVSIYRNAAIPAGILGLIVFTTIIYQLTGFMIWTAKNTIGVILIVTVTAALLINALSAIREASSMAIAILAVAIMLTPYYYLSVALITAATVTGREKSMWPMSVTYLITLAPLLVIENGLASTESLNHLEAGPIIFAQLLNLKQTMRPALTSLNIFLPSPTTSNFRDIGTAEPILNYLSGTSIYEMLIPLAILATIFSLTTTTAGLTNKTLKRIADIDGASRLTTLVPAAVSIITPLTFSILITSLSPRTLGGYQTTLQTTDTILLLLSSLTLGTTYTAKEYITSKLERTELARNALKTRLDTLQGKTAENQRLITHIQSNAPSIDLDQETKTTEEIASTLNDLKNGIDTMDRRNLENGIGEADKLAHKINSLPEEMRLKIIAEQNTLTTYTKTHGEALKEAGIPQAFKTTTRTKGNTTIEQALTDYTRLTVDVKRDANTLLESYTEARKAYNTLTSRPHTPSLIEPATLFDQHDIEAGLRQITEEHLLRFHHGSQAELKKNTATLLEAVKRFNEQQDTTDLREIVLRLESPKPIDSPTILRDTEALKTAIEAALQHIESETTKLGETLRTITPRAPEALGIDTTLKKKDIELLRQRNSELPPTFRDTTTLLEEATTLLYAHREEQRRNEEKLITAAHYPAAEKTINAKLGERRTIHLSELPYTDTTAHIYATMYTHANPTAHYNEEEETITADDKMH